MTTLTEDTKSFSLKDFEDIDAVFEIEGDDMRTHRGRSVVAVAVEGRRHFLKRFWFDSHQPFKRNVARGFHELRMIDWLARNRFLGPKVVQRGSGRAGPFSTRMFFLMREMPDEKPLETAWRLNQKDTASLLDDLSKLAATLHDAGFCHTDFSERHIFVGGSNGSRTFRLIDVERALVNGANEKQRAGDLATLAASVMDERLSDAIRTRVVDGYIHARKTLPASVDFRSLFEKAKPTRLF